MSSIYKGILIILALGLGIFATTHNKKPAARPPEQSNPAPAAPAPSPADNLSPAPATPAPPPLQILVRPPSPVPIQVPGDKPSAPLPSLPPAQNLPTPKPQAGLEQFPLIPSIYYISKFRIEDQKCAPEKMRTLNGTPFRVCREAYWSCTMEGTCSIEEQGVAHLINIGTQAEDGKLIFTEITDSDCRYGFGVRTICLDPFYTVAADPQFHRPGEVIYIDKIRGTVLPNGEIHNGYFIVRDSGKRILGQNRFDFFTGHLHYQNPNNPFSRIGLSSQSKNLVYRLVPRDLANEVRRNRGYPGAAYP